MKLKKITLQNYRGYGEAVSLDVDDLAVLVGENDIGKSTFLEALERFASLYPVSTAAKVVGTFAGCHVSQRLYQ